MSEYSLFPVTNCPHGGKHHGAILTRCTRCKKLLLYEDYCTPKAQPVVTIKCVECGTLREVKPQDAHQVTRCKPCQLKRKAVVFRRFLQKQGGAKCLSTR